ncbi:MAG: AI-2E family transporter, partial [Bacteroidales bacterium]|nr:AI-2E family transporter [Bacteroidales bacterium]
MNPLKPSLIEKNNSFFGQLLFLVVLIATGLLIFFKLNYLLSSLLGAITIYFLFRKVAFYFIEQKHWKPILVSLMIVVGMLAVVGVLGYFVVNILVGEIPVIDIQLITANLTEFVKDINEKVGFSLISSDLISEATNFISGIASSLIDTSYMFVVNLLMMFFILYFMFLNGRSIEKTLLSYAPIQGENLALIKNEVKNMVFGSAVGIPIIMIVQFVVAAIGYGIAGVDRFFFFAFL